MTQDSIYFNAFNLIPQIGSVRLRKLLNYFPSLETAWKASVKDLLVAGLEEPVVAAVQTYKNQIDPEKEFIKLEQKGIRLLTPLETDYPKLLREIPNPPITLYLRGNFLSEDETAVAIVGTRRCTAYGKQVAEELTRDLVRAGLTIVSGLAFGIDSIAHRTATNTTGRTIGVLACGVDSVYPASNRIIAENILETGGVILSEFPLGTPPLRHHFPYRNRIISGLALGTVVVEAAADSGALITARHALEQNRQVYAIPGSIHNPMSVGPNNLIKMGAKPVTSAQDILEDLNLESLQEQLITSEIIGDNEEEQKILAILTREPQHFDQITKTVSLPASTVASTLTIMEMKGKVRNLGANQYVRSR